MAIWETRPVTAQDTIWLSHWTVFETPDGRRYLVGHNVRDREGRVSTRVVSFDVKSMHVVTESGRTYKLLGCPGHNADGLYVWGRWAPLIGAETCEEVSEEWWAEHLRIIADTADSKVSPDRP